MNSQPKTKKSKLGILVIAAALLLGCIYAAFSQEVVPQTQTILKSYFTSGSRPSSTNYDELIDTTFWYILQCYTNAVYAQQEAVAAEGVWQAVGNITITNSGVNVGLTINSAANLGTLTITNNGTVALLDTSGGNNYQNYKITVNFASPLAGTNYGLNFSCPGANFLQTNENTETLPVLNPAIAHPSATNFNFNIDCYNATLISGLNLRFTVQ